MESKELEEVILPVQLEMIALESEEVTKEKSKGDSKDFALGFENGYYIGATEWAKWKVKYDELQSEVDKAKELSVDWYILQKKHEQLKERCEKMEAALIKLNSGVDKMWNECNTRWISDRYKKSISLAQAMCLKALAGKEGEKEVENGSE